MRKKTLNSNLEKFTTLDKQVNQKIFKEKKVKSDTLLMNPSDWHVGIK